MEDTTLVKLVHEENYRGYKIKAYLTRFGGLFVKVIGESLLNGQYITKYLTENILEARNYIDSKYK